MNHIREILNSFKRHNVLGYAPLPYKFTNHNYSFVIIRCGEHIPVHVVHLEVRGGDDLYFVRAKGKVLKLDVGSPGCYDEVVLGLLKHCRCSKGN